jgi:ATP-binding cassette subfamily B protein
MADRPPLYTQETVYSCGPACLRMVLEHFGTVRSEAALRDMCDCNPVSILIRGLSDALKVVNAARALGWSAAKHNMGFEELEREVGRGAFPIVNVMTRLTDSGPRVEHAVVVVGIAKDRVEVNDPWRGQYVYAKDDFIREWNDTYGLTILISKEPDGDG